MIEVWIHKIRSPLERMYTMKKRNAFWVLLAVGMAVVSAGIVNAQSIFSKEGFLGAFRTKSIVGSWEELVTFPSDVPFSQQEALSLFQDDGTFTSTGQGGVSFNTDPTKGSVLSDGIGAWRQLDWRTFGYTVESVISDLNGKLTGFFYVRGVYQLDSFGDGYTGHSYYQFLGPHHEATGPSAGPSGWVCNTGVRIRVMPPPTGAPPPCVPPQP
jgi:hypothetical protein